MIGSLLLFSMMTHLSSCQPLNRPVILGEDLAKALPAFSSMPGDAVVAFSPAAGLQKHFNSVDLSRVGRRYGITVPTDAEACFEWTFQPLTSSEIVAAIRDALRLPEARVEVLATSHTVVPDGKLTFALTGISASTMADPTTPVTWRGRIVYGGSRQFDIWARVRLSVTTTRVVATEDLLPDQVVTSSAVRLETYDEFPLKHEIARNLDEVVGKLTRRPIRAGLPVLRMDLADPFLVRRGDTVDVTVVSGAAEIHLQAMANTSGRQGDTISLTNTQTGKIFRARVGGRDKVILLTGPTDFVARVQ